ncbi:hypothetical protein [Verrucomicrobium spinosum]|uniref:hypothetical protein n=1 Tax=Verrucomicrobium spinosum TaxID=2736 RepID=UPI000301EA12|nr:hypothetical protein [Verrucomicrobium spinosum]
MVITLLMVSCAEIPIHPSLPPIKQFGGDIAADYEIKPDGTQRVTVVSEMHKSFEKGADVAGKFLDTLTTAYFAGAAIKVQETTKQMEAAGLSKAEIARIDAEARTKAAELAAKTSVTNKAMESGAVPAVNAITPP